MEITYITSKEKSNFPFIIQVKNTENWNTVSSHLSAKEAEPIAKTLAEKYPRLPVRIKYYAGGPMNEGK